MIFDPISGRGRYSPWLLCGHCRQGRWSRNRWVHRVDR